MIKAVFIDFYGTVVHEDGEVIKQVSQEIYSTGKVTDKSEIGTYWWNEFQKAFNSAYEDSFETQRKLEYESLKKTIEYFNSTANVHIAKLNGRVCGAKRPHSVFEQPICYLPV